MWQEIVVDGLCAVIAIAALAVAAWTLISGQVSEQGIDGLFLLVVCLLMAFAFGLIPARTLLKKRKANAAS